MTPKQFAGGQAGFSGSHDATIALVQSGSYQAGALNELVWDVAVKNGKVDPTKVKGDLENSSLCGLPLGGTPQS